MNVLEMEEALTTYLNIRVNLVVPNVSWGMFNHECDLLVLSSSGYAWEIEIKVDKYDLRNDRKKRHQHDDRKIKYLYFAIPDYLESEISYIPERAGIIVVSKTKYGYSCKKIRNPQQHGTYKFDDVQRYKLARLGALRVWTLKRNMKKLIEEKNYWKELYESTQCGLDSTYKSINYTL